MRRSGAPSQLLGNAVKKPRFLPPGTSSSFFAAESKSLAPRPTLDNALDKVQRSLSAPNLNKTGKASQDAPGLSRVLARVLSATESKENEADTQYQNPGLTDCTEGENLVLCVVTASIAAVATLLILIKLL